MKYRKHFIPIESNPTLFTSLAHTLGVSPTLEFHDALSLSSPELIALVPRPALALILAFPTTQAYEDAIAAQDCNLPDHAAFADDEPVMWFKQTINNACGLYALFHAVANSTARDTISPDSHLDHLLKACSPLPPDLRAPILEDDTYLEKAYAAVARQGDSAVPESPEAEVEFHYVCFVKSHKNGHLDLMDGDRNGPIDMGLLAAENDDVLVETALESVRSFVELAAKDSGFSLLALAPVYPVD
jgi:ubiquitin carboxyl-terminal hydrolase L3